jgi:hypothetical protein
MATQEIITMVDSKLALWNKIRDLEVDISRMNNSRGHSVQQNFENVYNDIDDFKKAEKVIYSTINEMGKELEVLSQRQKWISITVATLSGAALAVIVNNLFK